MQSSLFPIELIEETISCFKVEDGLFLTEKQADEYLHSFADLFLAFAEKTDRPASLEAVGRSALPSSDDRGVSNTSGTF